MRTIYLKCLIILSFILLISQNLYSHNGAITIANQNFITTTFLNDSTLTINSTDSLPEILNEINSPYTIGTIKAMIKTTGLLQHADERRMKNIEILDYGLNAILLLQPVSYNWKNDAYANTQIGLIAQDVRKVIPEIVKGDESKEIIGIDYNALIPVLINALKEQQAEIDLLSHKLQKQRVKLDH